MMESDSITVYDKNIATIYLKPICVDHTLNFLNFIVTGLVHTVIKLLFNYQLTKFIHSFTTC